MNNFNSNVYDYTQYIKQQKIQSIINICLSEFDENDIDNLIYQLNLVKVQKQQMQKVLLCNTSNC